METIKKLIFIGIFLMGNLASAQIPFENLQDAFSKSYEFEMKGNYISAVDQLKSVYQENSYETNLRLGWLNYMAGNFNESIAFYKKSIELMPYADEPKFGYTFPLSALGKWDEVVTVYNQILTNSSHNTRAMYYLGTIYYNRGQFDKAITYFKQIVDLYPFDYDGLLMYGWTNLRLGNKKDAKILFQKVLLNRPKDNSAKEGLLMVK